MIGDSLAKIGVHPISRAGAIDKPEFIWTFKVISSCLVNRYLAWIYPQLLNKVAANGSSNWIGFNAFNEIIMLSKPDFFRSHTRGDRDDSRIF